MKDNDKNRRPRKSPLFDLGYFDQASLLPGKNSLEQYPLGIRPPAGRGPHHGVPRDTDEPGDTTANDASVLDAD